MFQKYLVVIMKRENKQVFITVFDIEVADFDGHKIHVVLK